MTAPEREAGRQKGGGGRRMGPARWLSRTIYRCPTPNFGPLQGSFGMVFLYNVSLYRG